MTEICGTVKTPAGKGIKNATITLTQSFGSGSNPPAVHTRSDGAGDFSFCQVANGGIYSATPTLETDPLDGVNTCDLLLIARHILGTDPFNTPYQLIAADANKSGTITTFDVFELRKLILGTHTGLPQHSSWRFVEAAQVFSNLDNPFAVTLKEAIQIETSDTPLPANGINFIGCKIGDVDDTATPNQRPGKRPVTTLDLPVIAAKKGTTVTIPVTYSGAAPVEGVQFALRFDPAQWQLIAPSQGSITGLSLHNFGLSQVNDGIIRFSWNAMGLDAAPAQSGEVLFFLTFQALEAVADDAAPLSIDNSVMPEGAWDITGKEYEVTAYQGIAARSAASTAEKSNAVTAAPNPTSGAAALTVNAEQAGKIRLVLLDAFGNRLALRDVAVGRGQQNVDIPELATQPAGVYIWWVKMPDGTIAQGRIVKQ